MSVTPYLAKSSYYIVILAKLTYTKYMQFHVATNIFS